MVWCGRILEESLTSAYKVYFISYFGEVLSMLAIGKRRREYTGIE